ncbi:hypothetical protein WKR88_09315 [Trinickia caryophylli]|uniref:Lipoprotein-attachment site-containing protein n=1 Tax=Trinickia caryophylli TaxID=28094 RepID=A0A1X7FAJ4_TRICW|nr:hypothetical protein [Trinickia caryophylli]PMS10934.1 hypothetical protein C0Z17_17300 [Trinickia caryophylli]TRX18878.1 hypothetical protein FNF07_12005 [Trinickia caryophylli]WQE10324.1 hypothetical protein U0034_10910 [Trinickia caryophylli]SMF49179.1 hypothetical protein SAMN06295900_108133 [Trinickia caryophylli]GLU34229.1 hypothetical protein Busp01_40710 [Trinickia caryophylli]
MSRLSKRAGALAASMAALAALGGCEHGPGYVKPTATTAHAGTAAPPEFGTAGAPGTIEQLAPDAAPSSSGRPSEHGRPPGGNRLGEPDMRG